TAGEVTARRTGGEVTGAIALVNAPLIVDNAGPDVPSRPGALGDALHEAGLRTAVVGHADPVRPDGDATVHPPAAVSLMRSDGFVDLGVVDTTLLREQPRAPFGIASDPDRVVAAALDALAEADVVVVDNGDLDRLRAYDSVMTPTEREELRATT